MDTDCYDIAIAYLCQHPEELESAARDPGDHPIAGCLFLNAARAPYSYHKMPNGRFLGDPIAIHGKPEHFTAQDDIITERLVNDNSLPCSIQECNLGHLSRLAEYQREFDRRWDRKVPESQRITEVQDEEPADEEVS